MGGGDVQEMGEPSLTVEYLDIVEGWQPTSDSLVDARYACCDGSIGACYILSCTF